MTRAFVVDALRSPRGKGKRGKGALGEVHPQELLAQLLRAAPERSGFDPSTVDDVVVGCVSQAGDQGGNVARNAVLAAEWPESVTGVSLNRFCGSGLQAVNFGAMGVMSGQQDCVVAGGVESMSRQPIGSDGGGIDGNNDRLRSKIFQVPQGISADLIATREGFSRNQLDSFALRSQENAEAAQKEGRFSRSLVAVVDPATGEIALEADEYPRHGATLAGLGELNPAFVKLGEMAAGPGGATFDQMALKRYPDVDHIEHVHTAGNSSGIVDGAALVVLASEAFASSRGLKPRAVIRSVATAGAEPVIMLTAPAPASRKALAKAGMEVGDIDLWEINEAFATVPLQTMRELGIEEDRVNVNGGAIALGHPLGATGAILIGTLIDELERRDLTTGMATLCIGGGMGIATVIERL